MTDRPRVHNVGMTSETTILYNRHGRPIGESRVLPNGQVLERFDYGSDDGTRQVHQRNHQRLDDLAARQRNANSRRQILMALDAGFRRNLVKARAAERHENDQAGLATISWLPRNPSSHIQHANAYLPKGTRNQR